jgi:hypothetical protein
MIYLGVFGPIFSLAVCDPFGRIRISWGSWMSDGSSSFAKRGVDYRLIVQLDEIFSHPVDIRCLSPSSLEWVRNVFATVP